MRLLGINNTVSGENRQAFIRKIIVNHNNNIIARDVIVILTSDGEKKTRYRFRTYKRRRARAMSNFMRPLTRLGDYTEDVAGRVPITHPID